MKIAIIGTGVSGLSVANMLKDKHEVILFEKETRAGGLIKCDRVNDSLFHKVGGHVFNSRNSEVLNWFWSHFDRESEFVKAKRNAKVFFNDKTIGYPIENNLYSFDRNIVKDVIKELLELQKTNKISPFEYPNFEKFLQGTFGNTLYEIYFKPYNNKIWKTDLSTVSMQWLEGKLPMPVLQKIIESNIFREDDGEMVHSTFFYPKENGSQFIVDRLRKDLTVFTSNEITNIENKNNKFILNNNTDFDCIVYCGDIRKLPKYVKDLLQDNDIDLEYLEKLRSNGTSNLFCETDNNDISWLYIPEPFTSAHRIIYTGNFSETNNRGTVRKTCVVEFSGKVDFEVMKEEIKKLPGNLNPISFNYEPNSYVIQDQKTREVIGKAKTVLEKNGIYLLGRFAEWEYYNMDKAIEAAFAVCEKINK
jgi:protoporphyrinogen oxidase